MPAPLGRVPDIVVGPVKLPGASLLGHCRLLRGRLRVPVEVLPKGGHIHGHTVVLVDGLVLQPDRGLLVDARHAGSGGSGIRIDRYIADSRLRLCGKVDGAVGVDDLLKFGANLLALHCRRNVQEAIAQDDATTDRLQPLCLLLGLKGDEAVALVEAILVDDDLGAAHCAVGAEDAQQIRLGGVVTDAADKDAIGNDGAEDRLLGRPWLDRWWCRRGDCRSIAC